MERLSALQERLLSSGDNRSFSHAEFTLWLYRLGRLFSVNEKEVSVRFIGTPEALRSITNELLVIAGQCGINMEEVVWGKYPNMCPYPYCLAKPCVCGRQKLGPHVSLHIPLPADGLSLGQIQSMLGEIYPTGSSILKEFLDILQEIAEASWEVWEQKDPQAISDEFADSFARLMRLANTLRIRL